MSVDEQTNRYDLTYYATSFGVPYQRSEHWLTFFDKIAETIVREIAPSSVLDAGCAMGFLVEALRARGVEAYGVDISEYAIAQVAEPIKPYCWVGSLTDPLPRRYDLIVTIETLEHLAGDDVERAIQHLCAASDDVLFSSTPDDYCEPTHFSVQPPDAWASLFAAQSLWHDVEFDASFLTPWAMRFRRAALPAARAIRPLERALWELRRENRSLRDLVNAQRGGRVSVFADEQASHRIAELEAALAAEQTHSHQFNVFWRLLGQALDGASAVPQVATLRAEVSALAADNHHLRAELGSATTQLAQHIHRRAVLESRLSYKLYSRSLRTVDILAPQGSPQSRAWHSLSARLKGERAQRMERMTPRHRRAKTSHAPAGVASVSAREATPSGTGAGEMVDTAAMVAALATPGPILAARAYAPMPYEEWRRDAIPSRAERELNKLEIAQFTYQPTISLLTPVYDPPLAALHELIESVLRQTYERWELCLVDDGSTNPAVGDLLHMYAEHDARIKLRMLSADEHQGISGATNAAARLATGEFVQLCDHDDTLEPEALFEVVKALNADPTHDVLYCDEDKLSANGARYEEPFFKPDWSPSLLLCVNYLTHCVLRRTLFDAVGGCDTAMDGTQDWDLLLRVSEQTQRIHHIPQVLYHWRKAPNSAADRVAAKPYVFARQRRAVEASLLRRGLDAPRATFVRTAGGAPRLRVTWVAPRPLVSIIIPTRDKVHLLKRCLSSLFTRTDYPALEVILVDTGSVERATQAYYATLAANSQVRIIPYSGAFNYSRANNLGAAQAQGSLLLFLNNDTEVITRGWLSELARWAQLPEVGAVGAKLLFPSGEIQHAGVIMGMGGHAGHVFSGLSAHADTIFGSPDWYRDYLAVTGACMMTRREVFDQLGGFDEGYQIAFSDVQYCLSAGERGYTTVYTPYACLKHHESASRGARIPLGDIQRGYERMYPIVDRGDPYYNVNLATDISIPALALNDPPQRRSRLRQVVRQYEYLEDPTRERRGAHEMNW